MGLPGDPRWAFLTLTWTVMPFCVRLVFYLFRKGAGTLKRCDTWSELGSQFNQGETSHLPLVSSLHNIMRTKRLHQLKFGTNKFKMSNHKEVEGILADAGSTSEGESNYEAGPQAVTQLVIVLSTGEISTTQIISLCVSILSLSWGASRSYLILRPKNKSDPDPKLLTVLLRIWPWMFLVVVANLTFLVFIAGVAGWLVFPSLLLCCGVDLLALFYFCSRIEEVADAERGQTAESRAAFEKANQGFIYLASIASLWVPSVVDHQPQRIFLVSGLASPFTKVVILAVAVA